MTPIGKEWGGKAGRRDRNKRTEKETHRGEGGQKNVYEERKRGEIEYRKGMAKAIRRRRRGQQ